MTNRYPHLDQFEAKMAADGLDDMVIETFKDYYCDVIDGATGIIPDESVRPPKNDEVVSAAELDHYADEGLRIMPQAVRITLNGGLGTSMGLHQAKSLLPVKNGLTFLDIVARQALEADLPLVLMNIFGLADAGISDRPACRTCRGTP